MSVDDGRPSVYLAGPDVFRADSIAHGEHLKALCARQGLCGLYPMDNQVSGAIAIRAANMTMIRRSGAIIANLVAFRGAGADDGTAYELGAAAALGLPVFGYSPDHRSLLKRTAEWLRAQGTEPTQGRDGQWRDADGMAIEDFGLTHNLMLSCGLAGFYTRVEDAIAAAARHFRVAATPMPSPGTP